MSNQARRPRRYVVIPPPMSGAPFNAVAAAASFLRSDPRRAALVTRSSTGTANMQLLRSPTLTRLPTPAAPPSGLTVVKQSPPDGALLVKGAGTMAQVLAWAPDGAKVFEEQWYHLSRTPRPWMKLAAKLRKPSIKSGTGVTWTITVKSEADGTPLADALVTVMTNEVKGIGLELVTDGHGKAKVVLGKGTKRVDAVYVDPLHGGWPVALLLVDVASDGLLVEIEPIDLRAPDVRNVVFAKPPAGAGKGVVVGVVDTGVGKHENLTVVGGMNLTGEKASRFQDEQGHGTHVAGVIASSAAGWRRGEASKVKLRAYRIFKSGDDSASTFDIATAIKQAAIDGCDLINLSVGGPEDGTVKNAIDLAWEAGCVCVAATGNDGAADIDYPARYPRCVAVSAIGLEGTWPAGAALDWTLSTVQGKPIFGHATFFASFSNRGSRVLLTAPGIAVVSTIFDDRWGVMSGTSMATPIATGVLARRLAASPIMKMARDAKRSAAIVALARSHARDLGFTANRQGSGLAR